MRIVISGASGLIGTPLVQRLRAGGHDVVRLVRREPTAPGEVRWDPASGALTRTTAGALAADGGVDAAINLSGAGVGDKRWTEGYREEVLRSRTTATEALARGLAELPRPPSVLLQGSASGVYGDRGDEVLDEGSPASSEFLAGVCVAWEAAAQPARDAGIRVADLRTGIVLAPRGGAFGALLPLIRLGLGGPLGNGAAWWSWITLEDEVRAIEWLLTSDVSGPVNLVSPEPARNGDLIRAVAGALRRRALVPAPAAALRAAVGDFADEVLASRRVSPSVLLTAGFDFTSPDVETGARWLADAVRDAR